MDIKQAAKIFKALSNPNRLELYLKILACQESEFAAGCGCFISDIVSSFNIGAPTISHHIKELVNAELINTEKSGKFLRCTVNEEVRKEVCAMFENR